MTQRETERLAKVEQKLDSFIENSDTNFADMKLTMSEEISPPKTIEEA